MVEKGKFGLGFDRRFGGRLGRLRRRFLPGDPVIGLRGMLFVPDRDHGRRLASRKRRDDEKREEKSEDRKTCKGFAFFEHVHFYLLVFDYQDTSIFSSQTHPRSNAS